MRREGTKEKKVEWHAIRRNSRSEAFLVKFVLKICNKFTGEHPCRSVISIKLLCNFIEIALRHGCSPVNLLHIFRTPFSKNTFGWLLLYSAHPCNFFNWSGSKKLWIVFQILNSLNTGYLLYLHFETYALKYNFLVQNHSGVAQYLFPSSVEKVPLRGGQIKHHYLNINFLAGIYLFKVNNNNIRKMFGRTT